MKISENKYLRIYYLIINRARKRGLNRKKVKASIGYVELHHIIPKCIGGTNSEWNLVFLTFKEHYICHLILSRIFKNNYLINQSYYLMSHIYILEGGIRRSKQVSAKQANEFKEFTRTHKKPISESTKQKLREKNSGENNPNYGKKKSNETLKKLSNSLINYYNNVPKEKELIRRLHVSESLKGKPKSKEAVNKMKQSKILSGHKQTKETKEKKSQALNNHVVSEELKKDLSIRFGFAIMYYDQLSGNTFKFNSISSAVQYLKTNNILNKSFKYIKRSCELNINGFKYINKTNKMTQRKVLGPDGVVYESLTKCAKAFNTTRGSLLLWIKDYPQKGFKFVD